MDNLAFRKVGTIVLTSIQWQILIKTGSMEKVTDTTNIPNVKLECIPTSVESNQSNSECYEEKLNSAAAADSEELGDSTSRQPSNTNGLGASPGNHYLRNAILDEVLSEKKMALLWSPQVIKFLQDQQMAKRTNF